MLESIRKHQKLLQWLLLLLIFPSFAFFGIESYMRNVGSDADLVKVAGKSITRQELDNAVKAKTDTLQKQQGKIDSNLVNSVPFKQSVLNEIVQRRLLAYELKALKLAVSNEALSKELMQIPEIKVLYKDGLSFEEAKVAIDAMAKQQADAKTQEALLQFHQFLAASSRGIIR